MKLKLSALKKIAVTLTALTLALILTFTALGAPGFLAGLIWGGEQTLTDEQTAVPSEKETLGDSDPVSIQFEDCFFLEAEKNAFASNRKIRVKNLSERKMDQLQETFREQFPDGQGTVVWAFDVDAGMKPEERTPGSFQMTVQLEKLGIPEDRWDDVFLLRIDDDGNWFRYATERRGFNLTATSRQNSVVAVVLVSLGVGVPIGNRIIPAGNSMGYVRYAKSFTARQHIVYEKLDDKTTKPLINICYARDEVFDSLEKRLAVIKFDTFAHFKGMKEKELNQIIAKMEHCSPESVGPKTRRAYWQILTDEQLKKDAEYQKLLQEVEDHKQVIMGFHVVDEIGKQALDAYNHVKNTCGNIRMPSYVVDVHLVNSAEGFSGVTISAPIDWLKNPYICLNMYFYDGSEQKDFLDSVLLTLTHELLHVCQREYKNGSFSCLKFDEATAQMLELESREAYRKAGLISTPQSNTDKNYIRTDLFAVPLDETEVSYGNSLGGEATSFDPSEKNNTSKSEIGYPMARFLFYLRDKHRKNATYHDLLSAYLSFVKTPDMTALLKECFWISDEQLTADYHEFAVKNRNTLLTLARKQKAPWSITKRPVQMGKDNPVTVTNHSYTIRFHQFMPELPKDQKGPWKLLIANDPSFRTQLPDVKLYPAGEWNGKVFDTRYGILSSEQSQTPEAGFTVMESDGGTGKNGWFSENKSKLMAFILTPPQIRDAKWTRSGLQFRLPVKSDAASASCIDGYAVRVSVRGGKTCVKRFELKDANKKVTIPTEELLKEDFKGDKGKLPVTIEIKECLQRKNKKWAYGPVGKLNLNGGAEPQPEEESQTQTENPEGEGNWVLTGVQNIDEDLVPSYRDDFERMTKNSNGKVIEDYKMTGAIDYTYGEGMISWSYRVTSFEGFTSLHEGSCSGEYDRGKTWVSMVPKQVPNKDGTFEIMEEHEWTRQNCYLNEMKIFYTPDYSVAISDEPHGYGEYLEPINFASDVIYLAEQDEGPVRSSKRKLVYNFNLDPTGYFQKGDKLYLVVHFFGGGTRTTAYEYTCT